jgi:hypothetical protein
MCAAEGPPVKGTVTVSDAAATGLVKTINGVMEVTRAKANAKQRLSHLNPKCLMEALPLV